MTQSTLIDRFVSVALTVASLSIAGVLAYRTVSPPTPLVVERDGLNPVQEPTWREALPYSVVDGDTSSSVKILVVTDIECPACASFHRTLTSLRDSGASITTYSVHLSLPQHRFAPIAARAVECARPYSREVPMLDALYGLQDSLGLKDWKAIAGSVGGIRLASWEACLHSAEPLPNVTFGGTFAERIGVRATPTVIVNGWRLSRSPTSRELSAMIAAAASGRSLAEAATALTAP